MTDSCKRWPAYLVERACCKPQENCKVVEDSTPVVSFGNPVRAVVATISLNPSYSEFLERRNGPLLSGGQRRLATLKSLGVSSYDDMDCCTGAEIVDDCARYFERSPYERWFLPLDCILRAGARASYYADARTDSHYLDLACHLDLVQWATSDIWGKLEQSVKNRLLEASMPFLHEQLCHGHYRLVIINGSGVKNLIDRFWRIEWQEKHHSNVPSSIKLHECKFGDTQVLAWSRNIQREPEYIPWLARFVAERYAEFQAERKTP